MSARTTHLEACAAIYSLWLHYVCKWFLLMYFRKLWNTHVYFLVSISEFPKIIEHICLFSVLFFCLMFLFSNPFYNFYFSNDQVQRQHFRQNHSARIRVLETLNLTLYVVLIIFKNMVILLFSLKHFHMRIWVWHSCAPCSDDVLCIHKHWQITSARLRRQILKTPKSTLCVVNINYSRV